MPLTSTKMTGKESSLMTQAYDNPDPWVDSFYAILLWYVKETFYPFYLSLFLEIVPSVDPEDDLQLANKEYLLIYFILKATPF